VAVKGEPAPARHGSERVAEGLTGAAFREVRRDDGTRRSRVHDYAEFNPSDELRTSLRLTIRPEASNLPSREDPGGAPGQEVQQAKFDVANSAAFPSTSTSWRPTGMCMLWTWITSAPSCLETTAARPGRRNTERTWAESTFGLDGLGCNRWRPRSGPSQCRPPHPWPYA
jgi:hypothetical protein